MTDKNKLLYKIVKKLNGLSKIEAYELAHRLETFLFYASNPIDIKNLKQIVDSDIDDNQEIDPFHFTILPNGNFCEFDGSNDWLHIYKENKRILPNWPIFNTYYFKTKYAPLELIKLTKKNLLENIQNTEKEKDILDFLKTHAVTKKNVLTNKLLLLDS
ncbi:hypothetical protein [Aquimarina celericrescens]|uniref:IPExxxVDY family protein n=1 Tax=Aquimarina celericrescens TaxID=1964542 RepID=A0ABW5AWK1_9FLAO|nr:hypothetical protein [Aquimarina celericrescens]